MSTMPNPTTDPNQMFRQQRPTASNNWNRSGVNASTEQFIQNALSHFGSQRNAENAQAMSNLQAYQGVMNQLQPANDIAGILANQIFPELLSAEPFRASIGQATSDAMRAAGGSATTTYSDNGPTAGSSSAATRRQTIAERGGAAQADAALQARQALMNFYPQFAGAQARTAAAVPQMQFDPQANLSPAMYQMMIQNILGE